MTSLHKKISKKKSTPCSDGSVYECTGWQSTKTRSAMHAHSDMHSITWPHYSTTITTYNSGTPTSICYCIWTGYDSRYCNQSLSNSEPVENTYLWFIIPQHLSSLLMSPWQYLSSSVPRPPAPPRGCSLVYVVCHLQHQVPSSMCARHFLSLREGPGWYVREWKDFWSWCLWCWSHVCPDTAATDSEMR